MSDFPRVSGAMRAVGFVVLLGLFGSHLALQTTEFFPVDDAYISFRYAANLARGDGLVFNLGERVEGYSNFLFVVLLAAGSKLGITPPLAARLINVVSVAFLAGLLTFGGLPKRGQTEQHAGAGQGVHAGIRWLAGLILVLSPHTFLNVVSGLEAPATAGLLAAGVVSLGRGRPRLAALCFLLLAVSRPEGIVLALAAAGCDVWKARLEAPSRWRTWLLLLAVPYGLFISWRVAYYGSLLPNSVHAKSGFAATSHLEQALSYMGRAVDTYWPLMLLAVIGLVAGRRLFDGLYAWVALLGVTGLCLLTGSGDPYVTLIRYLYPGLPLLLMIASASARALLPKASQARPGSIVLGAGAVFLLVAQLALVVYGSGLELMRKEKLKALMDLGFREKITSGLAQLGAQDRAPHTSERLKIAVGQHDLARWLLDNADDDAVLVSSQVGIAPYYTGLRVVDTFGLVTRHIAALPGVPGAKKDPDFVFGQDPDFFVFRKPQKLIGGIPADAQLFRDPRLRWRYDLVRMFSLGGPRLLLFGRRDRPLFDIRYDFALQFSPQKVGRLDGETWRKSDPADRKLVAGRARVMFSGKKERRKLRRELEPTFRGAGADFQGKDAMRRWLEQWQSWIEHRPGTEGATAIRYSVQVPDNAFLRFGLGAPSGNRDPRKRDPRSAGAVRYSILVEDGGDVPPEGSERNTASEGRHQVFSAIQDPGRKPAHRLPREFEIDLRAFAGRQITIYLQAEYSLAENSLADRVAERPERGGWIEPILIRRPGAEGESPVLEADAPERGVMPADAEAK